MANGEAGPDGKFSESWYEAGQEAFVEEYGYRSTYLDEHMQNNAAEVPFQKELIEKHSEEIRRGTFDRRMLDRLPPAVSDKLRSLLRDPGNAALAADIKARKNILKNAVNTAVKPLPDGTQSPSALRMQAFLNEMFDEKLATPDTTPESAEAQTLAWFNEQLKDPNFKTSKGFPSMETRAKELIANEQDRLQRLKNHKGKMEFYDYAGDPDVYLSNKDLELKALDLQRGITDFSEEDLMVAKLMGYSHPLYMYQAFTQNKNRDYKGPEMDIPPIIQVAGDTFSQESKNLLFNNSSRNRTLRALSAEGLVNNLPQRPRPISSFAEQARGQVTFDTGQPGIDVFFEDKQFPAVLSGTVKEVSSQYNSDGSGYGNYIVIEAIDPATNEPVDVLYGHLAEPAQFNPGDQVSEGQVIGTQGGTGSVQSVDGTIASIDFLAPAAPGSGSMTPYRNYDSLRRRIAKDLGFK